MTTAADANDVPSPCVKRCRTDVETDVCSGCHRTVSEIVNWAKMSKERRRRVIARISALTQGGAATGMDDLVLDDR